MANKNNNRNTSTQNTGAKATNPARNPSSSRLKLKKAERLELDKEIQKSAESLKNNIKDLKGAYTDLANVLQQVVDNSTKFGEEFGAVENISKTMLTNLNRIGSKFYEQVDIQREINRANDKSKKLQEDQFELADRLAKLQREKEKAERKNDKREARRLAAEQEFTKAAIEENKEARKNLSTQRKILEALKEQQEVLNRAHEIAVKKGIDVIELTSQITAPFDALIDSIEKLPGGKFLSNALGLDAIKDTISATVISKFTSSLVATGSVGKASFAALSEGATIFMAALGPILPVLLAIAAAAAVLKAALDADNEVTNMARNLGVAKKEAIKTRDQFLSIALDTKVIGANLEALVEANENLNAILGTNVTASKDMLESQILLTKQYGLTSEEAANFQVTSAATGKTVDQNLVAVEGMVSGYNKMTGDSINFKEISKDIAKTSAHTLATYKGNVKALTLATIQAKKMGLTLEDTQSVADRLLDIESSIENEMTANVLTGKHMNLNAARQLALQGETAKAAAETVKQAGGYDDLMKLAPYQQKAIAEAAGLTVDQLTRAAELQKYSLALGGAEIKDMKDLTKEQIKQLENQKDISKEDAKKLIRDKQVTSTQEKLGALGDKLYSVLGKLADPILEIIDPLSEVIDDIMPGLNVAFKIFGYLLKSSFSGVIFIKDVFESIKMMLQKDLIQGLKDFGLAILKFVTNPIRLVTDSVNAILSAFGVSSQIKLPAWTEDKAKKTNDAMIGPDGGLIVSGQKGTYQLNENDTVIAGTSLGSLSSNARTANSVNTNNNNQNSEIAALLRELIKKVDQPVQVNVGGKVIDEIDKQSTLRKTYTTKVDNSYRAL